MLFTVVATISVAQADVLCISKAGKSRVAGSCNANEKTFQGSGPQGPAGPAGVQGSVGPQGPAGVGISNAACTQADLAGGWAFFLSFPNENDQCIFGIDANGKVATSSLCGQNTPSGTASISISSGSFTATNPAACGFTLTFTKANGQIWNGAMFLDRTRSNFTGIAVSIAHGESLIHGTKLAGVTNFSTNAARIASEQQLQLDLGSVINSMTPYGVGP